MARYADACNLFPGPELAHKLDVLRGHCDTEGRDYDTISKTVMFRFDVGDDGERVGETIEQLRALAGLGIDVAHGGVREPWRTDQFEIFAKEIIPAAAAL